MLNRALTGLLIAFAISALAALIYTGAAPRAEESFTEFYILDSQGMSIAYPRETALGKPLELMVGVVNHEQQELSYNLRIELNGKRVLELGPIHLASGQKWEEPFVLTPVEAGKGQRVDFLLYKFGDGEPYRQLYLRLDVSEVS